MKLRTDKYYLTAPLTCEWEPLLPPCGHLLEIQLKALGSKSTSGLRWNTLFNIPERYWLNKNKNSFIRKVASVKFLWAVVIEGPCSLMEPFGCIDSGRNYQRGSIHHPPSIIYSCVSGSPLQEDSLAGSPYVLSVGSPERSPSSFPSPTTRHLIYRNDHGLREPEDDPHTVPSPFYFSFFFFSWPLFTNLRLPFVQDLHKGCLCFCLAVPDEQPQLRPWRRHLRLVQKHWRGWRAKKWRKRTTSREPTPELYQRPTNRVYALVNVTHFSVWLQLRSF